MSRARAPPGFTDLAAEVQQEQRRQASDYVAPLEIEGPRSPPGPAAGTAFKRARQARRLRGNSGSDVFTFVPDKDIASFEGFHSPWWKKLLYYFVGLITAGFSFLMCKWSPRVHIFLSLSPCPLRDAQYVRIRLADGRVDLEKVQEVAMTEPHYDSVPTLAADEEEGAGRGGLLDWQVQRTHKLLEYRCTRYFYVDGVAAAAAAVAGGPAPGPGGATFTPVPALPKGFNEQLRSAAVTLATTGHAAAVEEAQEWDLGGRQLRYGTNEMAIPVKSIPMLIFDEMWHPFYVFQYFSILIWIVGDAYYSYAVCIAVITWFSIISAAYEAHQNMKRLAEIAHFECEVDVVRSGEVVRLPSSALVPGDLVVVAPGTLPCDMVLLRGECILDENMLTGESVPVRKVEYNAVADGLAYQPDKCPGCTLFGGTVVAQARAPRAQKPLAMVCRTRFYSAKGQLLRSILFPREPEESFISDSLRFICVMLAACMGLYIWAAVVLAQVGASPDRIVVRFFDMITIAVPPALPACLTIATVFSIGRLRKKGIYVTSPDRITLAGQLDVICFDKTGTLTEQGLDLQGIVPIVDGRLHNMVGQISLLPTQLVELLASCHGLARMGESLVGDPLDQKLFVATHWDLIDERPSLDGAYGGAYGGSAGGAGPQQTDIDGNVQGPGAGAAEAAQAEAEATGTGGGVQTYVRPPGAVHAYAIVKRFEFSAALQRNLVVVRAPDNSVAVFAKGSPEAIRALADPGSIPADFDQLLGELTREGLRVLALAAGDASTVPDSTLLGWTQAETEANVGLRLVGLAVMANPLRPDTADVISRLQHASIRTVMVTGDHLRTAVSVAHKCNILPGQRPILLIDAADLPAPATASQQQPTPLPQVAAAAATQAPAGVEPALMPQSTPLPVLRPAHAYSEASGPGPAGEPTPLGDPSIANPNWNGSLLTEEAEEAELRDAAALNTPYHGGASGLGDGAGSSSEGGAGILSEYGPASQHAHVVVQAQYPGMAQPGGAAGKGAVPVDSGNGHHHTAVTAAADAASAAAGPGLRLSVLDVEGNVTENAGSAAAYGMLARVVTGELECAVTGKGFNWLLASLDAGLLFPVLQRAGVFARMSPDNKRDLMLLLGSGIDGVEGCPHLGLRAGFCGDGANDCGALKAAHVGVSLCEAEASVAAPMTSKAQTIASMITVVAEGRCTLMATYQIFQFIIAYALVQAFETNLMYTYALNLGNYQYLIEDLFFTTVLAALMGFTEPRNKLSRSRPLTRVMSPPLMISTVLQCVVIVVFQLLSLKLLQSQPTYVRFRGGPELHDTVAPENTTTYIVALAQFVVLALVFNKGMPHRSPLWTNLWLVAVLVIQTAFVIYSLFSTDAFNMDVQQLVDKTSFNAVMDTEFRWKLFGLLVAMGITAFAAEYTSIGIVKLLNWAQGRPGAGSVRGTKAGSPESKGSMPSTVPDAIRLPRQEQSGR